jgi:hypothetical protein
MSSFEMLKIFVLQQDFFKRTSSASLCHYPQYLTDKILLYFLYFAYLCRFFFPEYRQYKKTAGDPCLIVEQP